MVPYSYPIRCMFFAHVHGLNVCALYTDEVYTMHSLCSGSPYYEQNDVKNDFEK